ncbi:Regulator of Vps4 activity in the MVB pathway family protein [Acanthocheilonema viteae]
MSISWGTQYSKLKTNLRLAINRLKLLEKKKTEMALKSRTEIADFIANHKEDRARIRVEHIIREDFLVEAYELLEMYCDLILARFGLIQQIKQLDDGIAEAVINIIWAAPRVATDVSEFKVINDQLTMKYGKTFAEAARNNQLEYPAKVSPKLIAKLSVQAPPKLLVERYMIEIAKCAGIPFTPDPNIMREDEVAAAEQMLIDFRNQGGQGYGWMYSDGSGSDNKKPPPPPNDGSAYYPGPPPPPPAGFKGAFEGNSTPTSDLTNYGACNYPCLNQVGDSSGSIKIKPNTSPGVPSAPPTDVNSVPSKMNLATPEFPEPPTDFPEMFDPAKNNDEQQPGSAGANNELDFDDLAKRFDMLKKKNVK